MKVDQLADVDQILTRREPKDYEVGYCKPPKETQYMKGQSGNSEGRPVGSRNKPKSLTDFGRSCASIILAEARRTRSVPSGDGDEELTLLQMNARRLGFDGARGRAGASRDFIDIVARAEKEEQDAQIAALTAALDYKEAWEEEEKRVRARGGTWVPPVPHPDQVLVDVRRSTVHIVGPAHPSDIPIWQELAKLLPDFRRDRAEIKSRLKAAVAMEHDGAEADLARIDQAIAFLELGCAYLPGAADEDSSRLGRPKRAIRGEDVGQTKRGATDKGKARRRRAVKSDSTSP